MNDKSKLYEFAFLLRTGESEEPLTSLLKEAGADIITAGPINDIQLAYPIKKSRTARFGYYQFTVSDSSSIFQMDKKLKLDARVLRFLFVKVPKVKPASRRSPAPRKRDARFIPSVTPMVSHLDTLSNEKLEQTLEEILK